MFSAIDRIAELDGLAERVQPIRPPGRLLVDDGFQCFDLLLRPDSRHCWRFYSLRDGEPFVHGGLEAIWREVQRRRAPVLGSRRMGSY